MELILFCFVTNLNKSSIPWQSNTNKTSTGVKSFSCHLINSNVDIQNVNVGYVGYVGNVGLSMVMLESERFTKSYSQRVIGRKYILGNPLTVSYESKIKSNYHSLWIAYKTIYSYHSLFIIELRSYITKRDNKSRLKIDGDI